MTIDYLVMHIDYFFKTTCHGCEFMVFKDEFGIVRRVERYCRYVDDHNRIQTWAYWNCKELVNLRGTEECNGHYVGLTNNIVELY